MTKEFQVSIIRRHVSFEVKVPREHVWDFIQKFGALFPRIGSPEGQTLRPVDTYRELADGWRIKVSVLAHSEAKFYEFLSEFCLELDLSYDDSATS